MIAPANKLLLFSFFCLWSCYADFATAIQDTSAIAEDIVLFDFEGETYGQWEVSGTAFGKKPARGTLPNQMAVDGFQGEGLVNSFVGGDDSVGRMLSPAFKIERRHINFLIGGGLHPETACIQLLIGDAVKRSATGPNGQAGGSERLDWAHWDVTEFIGQQARIQIVDEQKGGWGHINVDHIVQSDTPARAAVNDEQKELLLEEKLLLLPIANQSPQKMVEVVVDGEVVHKLDVNLATGQPDWWAYLDVSPWRGKNATVKVVRLQNESKGLDAITTSNRLPDGENLYDELLRPQLRFSQKRGWNNDPNGMVYLNGQYHFFWQSNPAGWDWSNMYWGHAVSSDLVHWEEKPHALFPYLSAKKLCFSGSGNVDVQNTGGWQVGDTPTMLLPFTDTGAGEALVISTDGGETFRAIDENPIIKHIGRDPKLLWYEYDDSDRPLNEVAEKLGGHWVIAVYDEEPEHGQNIAFYVSTDLKKWEFVSRNSGFFECPELFSLPVDGDENNRKWVLFAADAKYVIGSFDGLHFQADSDKKHQLHHGEFYASQCFSLSPDGRVIQVGWARIPMPNMPFNQAFSLPLSLSLKTTNAGIRMFANPVKELDALRATTTSKQKQTLAADSEFTIPVESQLLDVEVELAIGTAKQIVMNFGQNRVVVDVENSTVEGMPAEFKDGTVKLRLLVDRPMFELVVQDGARYLTKARQDGGEDFDKFSIKAKGGEASILRIDCHRLDSIWDR